MTVRQASSPARKSRMCTASTIKYKSCIISKPYSIILSHITSAAVRICQQLYLFVLQNIFWSLIEYSRNCGKPYAHQPDLTPAQMDMHDMGVRPTACWSHKQQRKVRKVRKVGAIRVTVMVEECVDIPPNAKLEWDDSEDTLLAS